MTRFIAKTVALCTLAALTTACNPILRTHGYVPTVDAKPQEVNPETDTKATVLARLGNPSVESTFDEDITDDTWFYMNAVRQRYAYLRPKVEERTITAITFNEDGQVTKANMVSKMAVMSITWTAKHPHVAASFLYSNKFSVQSVVFQQNNLADNKTFPGVEEDQVVVS